MAVCAAAVVLTGCTGDDGTTPARRDATATAAAAATDPAAPSVPANPSVAEGGDPSSAAPVAGQQQTTPAATAEPLPRAAATPPSETPAASPRPRRAAPSPPAAQRRRAAPASYVQPIADFASAAAVVRELVEVERLLSSPGTPPAAAAQAARRRQLAYRQLVVTPAWREPVYSGLPAALRERVRDDVTAGAALRRLGAARSQLPRWRIVAPEPADRLLAHYRKAQRLTGIHWTYLAAINLVETKMGRIQGLSTAGARGPMQFMPGTWAEVGRGDIDDPHDSIQAAARYLVRRGGLRDISKGLRGYNNSRHYVTGVRLYAERMQRDPAAYRAYHQWQVIYALTSGDVVLREGFDARSR